MSDDLKGRVALVTGSARGIGRAVTTELAARGAAAMVHGLEREEGRAFAAELKAKGVKTGFSDADLAKPDGVAALREATLAAVGEPDILMLNASVEYLETWDKLGEETMALQTEINLHATVRLLQAFLPGMLRKGWGRVIAVGSVQEHRPNDTHFYYVATKAAQTNMMINLARTVRHPKVTFNVVQPGAILTDRNRHVLADDEVRQRILERTPLGRLGDVKDVVGIVAFLCTEAAGFMNGSIISADGGLRL